MFEKYVVWVNISIVLSTHDLFNLTASYISCTFQFFFTTKVHFIFDKKYLIVSYFI
jgi:hypothetical protein